jgi:NAD+ synthase (glutamine-hydrolysing)
MNIYIAQYNPTIGDISGNTSKILNIIDQAQQHKCDLVLFPELAICGYIPCDFLLYDSFIKATEQTLKKITSAAQKIAVVIGTIRPNPAKQGKKLFNTAAIIDDGKLLGFQDKTLLPDYGVFNETRYFEPSEKTQVWNIKNKKIAITICEDLWTEEEQETLYSHHRNPLLEIAPHHPELLLNLSASPFHQDKYQARFNVLTRSAKQLDCPVVSCNQVGANDVLIYDGNSMHINRYGELVHKAKSFEEDFLLVDTNNEIPSQQKLPSTIENIYHALVLGVRDYCNKTGFTKVCLGLSGGIDSALVAVIAAEALGPQNVLGVNMPSRYSSNHSITDSEDLIKNLGIKYQQIPIEDIFSTYLTTLSPVSGVAEENLQPRIRGTILMSLSNQEGHLLLSTGNKSENAMGYATLYGDMCGGLSVIGDVYKTTVYKLAKWINRHSIIIPENTITKPPSAELCHNQKDTDTLPEYDVVDNIIRSYVRLCLSPQKISQKHNYPLDLVQSLIKKIHLNIYKRRQSAPILRISKKAFVVDRKLPIAHKWNG